MARHVKFLLDLLVRSLFIAETVLLVEVQWEAIVLKERILEHSHKILFKTINQALVLKMSQGIVK